MKLFRIILIISIVFIFLVNTGFLAPLYEYSINELRTETKVLLGKVSANELIHLTVSTTNPDLKLLEEDEMDYMGKRYDIISLKNKGDSSEILCMEDKAEQIMLESYHNMLDFTSYSKDNGKERNKPVKMPVSKDYLQEHPFSIIYSFNKIAFVLEAPQYGTSKFNFIISPPPKNAIIINC